MELRGIVPALTTPYSDGEVSLSALRRNIGRYERLALAGYLVLGSTGEAVLLDPDERSDSVEAIRAFNDLVPDLPGLHSVLVPIGDGCWVGVTDDDPVR